MSTKCWITAVNKRVLWIRYDSASTRRGQTWSFKRHTWPSGSLLPSKCLLNNGGTVSKTSVMCSLPFWMCARVQEDIILWPEVRRLLFLLNKLISDPCQQQRKSFQRRWPKLVVYTHLSNLNINTTAQDCTGQECYIRHPHLIYHICTGKYQGCTKNTDPENLKRKEDVAMLQPNCSHHTATNRFFCFYTTLHAFTLQHTVYHNETVNVPCHCNLVEVRIVTSILTTQIYGQTSPKVVWTPLTYPGISTCP